MNEIVTHIKENEWKDFLLSCNNASIYHTPEWKTFLEKTFNYDSHYLFAKDSCGNIVGLLPLFHVKSKLTGNRLCSLPFSHNCGYIGSRDAEHFLINEGLDLYSKLDANFFEIRDLVTLDGFQSQNSFSTYILELSDKESTWNSIHGSMKRYIKKSLTSLEVVKSNFSEDADLFYEVNCKNKKNKVMKKKKKYINKVLKW